MTQMNTIRDYFFLLFLGFSCSSLPPGNSIAGCISGNCNNGFGVLRNQDGVYAGEFQLAKKHGEGTLIHDAGLIYSGSFSNDLASGYGRLKFRMKEIEGKWSNNSLIGDAKVTVIDEKSQIPATYYGPLQSLEQQTLGIKFQPLNEQKFIPTGQGKIDFGDGSYYEGDFGCQTTQPIRGAAKIDCGLPKGQGTVTYQGNQITGQITCRMLRVFIIFASCKIQTPNNIFEISLDITESNAPLIFRFKKDGRFVEANH